MSNAAKSLDEVLERTGLAARWEARGMAKGREEGREEIARNALAKGFPIETIHDLTGLDMETIMRLAP